jgi:hypothetical protein
LVPDALRGRVISFFTTFSLGFTIFGSIMAGFGASYLPAPTIVAIGGILTIITSGLFWRALPNIRRHISEHGLMPQEGIAPS